MCNLVLELLCARERERERERERSQKLTGENVQNYVPKYQCPSRGIGIIAIKKLPSQYPNVYLVNYCMYKTKRYIDIRRTLSITVLIAHNLLESMLDVTYSFNMLSYTTPYLQCPDS